MSSSSSDRKRIRTGDIYISSRKREREIDEQKCKKGSRKGEKNYDLSNTYFLHRVAICLINAVNDATSYRKAKKYISKTNPEFWEHNFIYWSFTNGRNVYGTKKISIFFYCCLKGFNGFVSYMVEHNVNINSTNSDGENVIFFILKKINNVSLNILSYPLLQYLVSNDIDVNTKKNDKYNLFSLAFEKKCQLGFLKFLLEKGIKIITSSLKFNLIDLTFKELDLFLQNGLDIDYLFSCDDWVRNTTLLLYYSKYASMRVGRVFFSVNYIALLLKYNANPFIQDEFGNDALHYILRWPTVGDHENSLQMNIVTQIMTLQLQCLQF